MFSEPWTRSERNEDNMPSPSAHGISHGNLKRMIEISNTNLMKLLEPDQNIDLFWTVLQPCISLIVVLPIEEYNMVVAVPSSGEWP